MAEGRRAGLTASIAVVAAVVTAVVTGAAVYAVMYAVSVRDGADYVARLYAQTGTVFKAAVDPRFQSKADEVIRVLDRLVVIDAVEGGAIFDDTGHLQQTFGEKPDTAFEATSATGETTFAARDRRRVEFYYPPETTGTPFHIIARVAYGSASALEAESVTRRMIFAGVAAVIAGLVAGALIEVWVIRPLRRIAAVVDRIIIDPAGSEQGPRLPSGRSEIGILGATVERFRGTLADIWRTKVSVADAILERSPFAVVQMTPDGAPLFANPAATDLFEREIVRGQTSTPLTVRDIATGAQATLRDHLQRHRGGLRPVEIVGTRGMRFAVAASLTVGADTRSATTIAMFADATDLQLARMEADARSADGEALLRSARRRELELKLTLEACITLMAGPDRQGEEQMDAVPFALEWMAAAKDAGIASETVVLSAEGPAVMGPVDDLRAVMRLGLLVCYARCGSAPADLIFDAKGINFDTAGFTIRAQKSPVAADGGEPVAADWQLAFAALRTAIRRVNGQLSEFNVADDGVVLRLILRGAAERLSTVKAR